MGERFQRGPHGIIWEVVAKDHLPHFWWSKSKASRNKYSRDRHSSVAHGHQRRVCVCLDISCTIRICRHWLCWRICVCLDGLCDIVCIFRHCVRRIVLTERKRSVSFIWENLAKDESANLWYSSLSRKEPYNACRCFLPYCTYTLYALQPAREIVKRQVKYWSTFALKLDMIILRGFSYVNMMNPFNIDTCLSKYHTLSLSIIMRSLD